MLRSLISRSRGMPCTHDDDSRSTRTGIAGRLGGVGHLLDDPPRRRRHREEDQVDVVAARRSRGARRRARRCGTPWIERLRSAGLSSTATTGMRPSIGDCCISRSAAAPLVPAPTTATRMPVPEYEERRNANRRCWKRTMPNRKVEMIGPATSTVSGMRSSAPHEREQEDRAGARSRREQPDRFVDAGVAPRAAVAPPHPHGDDAAPRRRPGGRPGTGPSTRTGRRSRSAARTARGR